MKNSTWMSLFLLVLVCGVALAMPRQGQSSLPPRDATTVADLFERLGRCTNTVSEEQKYQEKLVARIHELEKEIAVLKTPRTSEK